MSTVRVATYNLYLGADMTVIFRVGSPEELAGQARAVLDQVVATDFPARAAAIARILVAQEVDVVGLQEVAQWSRVVREPGAVPRAEVWLDFLDELVDALAAAGNRYDVHACGVNFSGSAQVDGDEAMGVLGRNAILVRQGSGVDVIAEHTGDFSARLDIETGIPGVVLRVARSWGWVDAAVEGRRLRFVNAHTEAWDERIRNAQRDELLGAVGDPGCPVVLVGDLNATPDRVGMPPAYVDAWVAAGTGGPGLTCGQTADLAGEDALAVRIDYVWVRDAAVARCWVVGNGPGDRTASGLWPSDHAGVVADVVV